MSRAGTEHRGARGRRASVAIAAAIGALAAWPAQAAPPAAPPPSPDAAPTDLVVEAAGRTVNAHAWSTAVLTAASLHLSLASPAARLFELKPKPGPMQFDLVDEPFWHDSGSITAPGRAGHGAEPKPAVIEKYQIH